MPLGHPSPSGPIALLVSGDPERFRDTATAFSRRGVLMRFAQDDRGVTRALAKRPWLVLVDLTHRAVISDRTIEHINRLRGRALVVGVSAGGMQEIERVDAQDRRVRVTRERPRELAALVEALQRLTAPGAAGLEPARQAAVLATLDERLAAQEAALRAADAEAAVRKYTRRAVVGALAAVAPGTDLVIQGALATALLRELTALYGLGLRDVDLDRFVERAGGTVRTATSVTLAIAGNALKAFPGLGTLGGGLVHAVAYGMVFDSLGRAVAATLAERGALDANAALARLDQALVQAPEPARLGALLRLARDAVSGDREPR